MVRLVRTWWPSTAQFHATDGGYFMQKQPERQWRRRPEKYPGQRTAYLVGAWRPSDKRRK